MIIVYMEEEGESLEVNLYLRFIKNLLCVGNSAIYSVTILWQ